MSEFVDLMAAPFSACLVLVGIHTYLGLHVLEREVIFVDLALAQVAALGAVIGTLFGVELQGGGTYFFSLGATLFGAALFTFTRPHEGKEKSRVPHEAVIGIVYAVSAAAVILVLARVPRGAEHVQELLVGSILWETWEEVGKIAGIYVLIGVFHWVFRKKFLLVSRGPEEARRAGVSVRFWDFLFYVSFGFMVTISVGVAGVLLVFCILIIPAVAAALATEGIRSRILIGWAFGAVGSMAGVTLSYGLDLPTGAAVVCTLGLLLMLWGIGVKVRA
jgi:zinc/manganese transport system permease protein